MNLLETFNLGPAEVWIVPYSKFSSIGMPP
jgi:hypothetical protein